MVTIWGGLLTGHSPADGGRGRASCRGKINAASKMPLPARLPNPASLLSAGSATTVRRYFQGSPTAALEKSTISAGPVEWGFARGGGGGGLAGRPGRRVRVRGRW